MKVVYVKYNRLRLKQYQTEVVIYQNKSGLLVRKNALTQEANQHIKQMFENYKLLKESHNCVIDKAKLIGNSIFFSYVCGKSWEQLLFDAIVKEDKKTFFGLLEKYMLFITNLAPTTFSPGTIEFAKDLVFKELCFEIGNIDLNFDNIIIDEKGRMVIIDYEWVFPNIPVLFVVFRAIFYFFLKYEKYIEKMGIADNFFYNLGFDAKTIGSYRELEYRFQKYANGNSTLSGYQKKIHTLTI